jgi:tRNA-dihydrouridine synthase C
MDGVTDPAFRGLVLALGDAGGAVTEFVRITTGPISLPALRREVGPVRPSGPPVGLQLMMTGPEGLAETVANAGAAGAAWVDLNFGCPVRRVFNKCAGSALLAHPEKVGELVRCAAQASTLPVSAKLRAGIDDASLLDDNLHAAAEGGAAMVTLHARLRTDSYAAAARWEWIARAAELLHGDHPGVALVGNGGIDRAADAPRMLRETGCDGVMVGRAALADPWIFREISGGPPATAAEAAAFALDYGSRMLAPGALRGGPGKVKLLVKAFRAGGLFTGREELRTRLLRALDAREAIDWFRSRTEESAPGGSPAVEGADGPVPASLRHAPL